MDGVLFGGLRSFPYGENMILSAHIGQSLNLGRTRLAAAVHNKRSSTRSTFLAIDRNSQPQKGTLILSEVINSLFARFSAQDYFDWYWSVNIRGGAHYQARTIRMTVEANYTWLIH